MMVLHLNKDYFGHDLSLSNICLVKTSLMTIIDNYFNKGSFFQNNRRKWVPDLGIYMFVLLYI